MNSGSKQTTQTTTNEPWKASQDLLKGVLGDAEDLGSDPFKAYTGSRVVPFASQTQQGMSGLHNLATGSAPGSLQDAYGFYGGVFGEGGLSPEQQGVRDQWSTTASGAELLNTSPEFENVLGRALGDTRDQINLTMSGAGRYGSPGAHQGTLARELGSLSSQARLGEYGRQLGRMDTSRTNLANLGQQGLTNQFGAASALPDAYSALGQPSIDLMGLGSMQEDLSRRQLEDQERISRETQEESLRELEWLNAIGTGAGSLGGTSHGQFREPAPNPFLQAGAGVLGLNSLLGGLF